jgi:hypothetical protein
MSVSIEKAKFRSEMGNTFEVQFNPSDIQLDAKADWATQKAQADQVKIEFKSVSPRTLSMTLVFDTTTNNSDVRVTYVNQLMNTFTLKQMPDLNPEHDQTAQGTLGMKKRNVLQTFEWGNFSFMGAITGLSTKYTMFSKDGNPVRAEVKVQMTEYVNQEMFQVGGSRSNITIPQVKLVQMEAGQTLSGIASAFGTSMAALAQANGISDPMNVPAGTILGLPF